MKHFLIAAITALIATAATAQQTPCTYTSVQTPDGKYVTCIVCGSFTSCS